MSILKITPEAYKKKIDLSIFFLSLGTSLILILDVLLMIFRNDKTHVLFLLLSLFLSLAVVFIAIWVIDLIIIPKKKMLNIYKKSMNLESFIIEIKEISEETIRYNDFTTHKVSYIKDNTSKECFLIEDTFNGLKEGKYKVSMYRNIIVRISEYE